MSKPQRLEHFPDRPVTETIYKDVIDHAETITAMTFAISAIVKGDRQGETLNNRMALKCERMVYDLLMIRQSPGADRPTPLEIRLFLIDLFRRLIEKLEYA